MAPIIRRLYDQMLEPKWVIAMGACSSSMGVFNNYAITPADKFLPVDVHVPGCPPRPEALMHGIVKLRAKIQQHPDEGWRSRYGGHETEEVLPGPSQPTPRTSPPPTPTATERGGRGGALTGGRAIEVGAAMPDATGLELLAQDLREADEGTPSSTPFTSATRRRSTSSPRRSAPCSTSPRDRGFTLPVERPRRRLLPEEPRLGVHYELLDMDKVDRLRVKLRVPTRRRRGGLASSICGRPPTTRSARSTTCSA